MASSQLHAGIERSVGEAAGGLVDAAGQAGDSLAADHRPTSTEIRRSARLATGTRPSHDWKSREASCAISLRSPGWTMTSTDLVFASSDTRARCFPSAHCD